MYITASFSKILNETKKIYRKIYSYFKFKYNCIWNDFTHLIKTIVSANIKFTLYIIQNCFLKSMFNIDIRYQVDLFQFVLNFLFFQINVLTTEFISLFLW